ncbi:protein NPGR1 [Capsicum chacoense]
MNESNLIACVWLCFCEMLEVSSPIYIVAVYNLLFATDTSLLGKLKYQRGNFDADLQVFHGISIRTLSLRMSKSIAEGTRPLKPRSKGDVVPVGMMLLHSVSLLLQANLLKAKSLEETNLLKANP